MDSYNAQMLRLKLDHCIDYLSEAVTWHDQLRDLPELASAKQHQDIALVLSTLRECFVYIKEGSCEEEQPSAQPSEVSRVFAVSS